MPSSKLKSHIAEILQAEGYISGWTVEDAQVGKYLTIQLKFGPNRERSLAGMRRISKPGLRVYAKSTNLPKVLGGLGVAILSTSSGLLTDKQATRRAWVGKSSPTSGNPERRETPCLESASFPSRSLPAWTSPSAARW